MNLEAITHLATTVYRNFSPNYMKVTAATVAVIGGVVVGTRRWSLSCNRELDEASTKVKKKLKVIYAKLDNWKDDDAKQLTTILHSDEVCRPDNPLPYMEFTGPKPHFRTLEGLVKTLTTIANRVSAAQNKWLKETKEKALEWLKAKDKLSLAVSASLHKVDDVDAIYLANKKLGEVIEKAKKQVKEEKVTAETIQQQMAAVKIKYDIVYGLINPKEENLQKKVIRQIKRIQMSQVSVGGKIDDLQNWFPEEGGDLKELSAVDLKDTYTARGKIEGDDKNNVDQAIAGLAHEDLLKAVDRKEKGSIAHTAYKEFKKWNADDSGLYNPLWVCTGFALVILGANWGAPHYLGADHHIVQLFKLPA